MALLDQLPELLASPPAEGWQSTDFAGLDQLHIGGLAATKQLLAWLPASAHKGLDMGGGLGGCARMLALEHACSMTVSDLDESYIAAGQLLNDSLTPQPDCQYVTANSLQLPFAEQSFDLAVRTYSRAALVDPADPSVQYSLSLALDVSDNGEVTFVTFCCFFLHI